MDTSDPMYLENIEEFINDENKIVTYRWLSLTLNVSSNVAKQMLYQYHEKNKDNLTATYLITGILCDEKLNQDVHKVCVIRDEDLESTKKKMKKVSSVHLYSLQKGPLKDLHLLYAADFDKIRENLIDSTRHSAIKCPSASVRLPPKNQQHRTTPSTAKNSSVVQTSKPTTQPPDGTENKENKSGEENIRKKDVPKKAVKGAIASMFANQVKKAEATKKEEKKPETLNAKATSKTTKSSLPANSGPKRGALSSFFTKGGVQPPLKTVKKEETAQSHQTHENESVEDCKDLSVEAEETKLNDVSKVEKKVPASKSPKKKSKPVSKGKRKSSSSVKTSESKRRRIVAVLSSSSESSDEEEEIMDECPFPSPPPAKVGGTIESDDDDDIIPPTPEETPSHDKVTEKGKRRKRKLVDKTYEDEEGYLVTKKEYEFVSDSNDEDPLPKPKPKPKVSPETKTVAKSHKKSPPTVKKSPTKTKQSTLMSFFQRK